MLSSIARKVPQGCRRHLSELSLKEASGALGDLGTFLPLIVGLVQVIGLDLGATLIATGIYNVVTGFQFGIPMPVQPMKTITAVALGEESLSVPEVVVGGLSVSVVVLFLGATGLMETFNRLVPLSLVRGIQLAVGLKLSIKGLKMALYKDDVEWRDWGGIDGLGLSLLVISFILITTMPSETSVLLESRRSSVALDHEDECRSSVSEASSVSVQDNDCENAEDDLDVESNDACEAQGSCEANGSSSSRKNSTVPFCSIPTALILVVLGIILTIAFHPTVISSLTFGPSRIKIIIPSLEEVKTGILRAGLPQLPLTTLNSVVAVCNLSQELFPQRPASPNSVALSVGIMNIVGSWFGVMPCCHGAGGLAAQSKFGAKTGTAPIFLGLVKIALGLLFGSSLFSLLQKFPKPLLGAMLLFSGIELAGCCKSERDGRGVGLMLMTALASFATNNTAIGFGFGAVSVLLLNAYSLLLHAIRKQRSQ